MQLVADNSDDTPSKATQNSDDYEYEYEDDNEYIYEFDDGESYIYEHEKRGNEGYTYSYEHTYSTSQGSSVSGKVDLYYEQNGLWQPEYDADYNASPPTQQVQPAEPDINVQQEVTTTPQIDDCDCPPPATYTQNTQQYQQNPQTNNSQFGYAFDYQYDESHTSQNNGYTPPPAPTPKSTFAIGYGSLRLGAAPFERTDCKYNIISEGAFGYNFEAGLMIMRQLERSYYWGFVLSGSFNGLIGIKNATPNRYRTSWAGTSLGMAFMAGRLTLITDVLFGKGQNTLENGEAHVSVDDIKDKFFTISPRITMTLNCAKWLNIDVTVGYLQGFSENFNVNNFYFLTGFSFGNFHDYN